MADRTTEELETPVEEQLETDDSNAETENEWEVKYKELQKDYTKKSQKLAELEKSKQTEPTLDDQEQQLKERTKKNVVDEEVKKAEQRVLEEVSFRELLTSYPELREHEKAIRDLRQSTGKTFEEVAIEYGFTTSDKLEKAKSSRSKMVGTSTKKEEKKDLSSLSLEEYAKVRNDLIPKGGGFERINDF